MDKVVRLSGIEAAARAQVSLKNIPSNHAKTSEWTTELHLWGFMERARVGQIREFKHTDPWRICCGEPVMMIGNQCVNLSGKTLQRSPDWFGMERKHRDVSLIISQQKSLRSL